MSALENEQSIGDRFKALGSRLEALPTGLAVQPDAVLVPVDVEGQDERVSVGEFNAGLYSIKMNLAGGRISPQEAAAQFDAWEASVAKFESTWDEAQESGAFAKYIKTFD